MGTQRRKETPFFAPLRESCFWNFEGGIFMRKPWRRRQVIDLDVDLQALNVRLGVIDILDELPALDADSLVVLEEFCAGAKVALPLPDEAYEKFNPMGGEE
jgi:hypothetical protein